MIRWSYIQHTGIPSGVPFFIDIDIMKRRMPRNSVTRKELEVRVLKIKNSLYDGTYQHKNGEWHDGAHTMLNKFLDILQEYRV